MKNSNAGFKSGTVLNNYKILLVHIFDYACNQLAGQIGIVWEQGCVITEVQPKVLIAPSDSLRNGRRALANAIGMDC